MGAWVLLDVLLGRDPTSWCSGAFSGAVSSERSTWAPQAAGAAEQEVTGRPWIALQALPRVQAALVLLAEGEVILGEAECPLGHSHQWWLPRGCGVLTGLFLACC